MPVETPVPLRPFSGVLVPPVLVDSLKLTIALFPHGGFTKGWAGIKSELMGFFWLEGSGQGYLSK